MGGTGTTGAVTRASSRPTFVLVHSPLVGPSIWHWAGAELRRFGIGVVIPDMTGFENAGAPYWEPCVQAVVLACSEAQGPLVLVGHGGAAPLLPGHDARSLGSGEAGRVRRSGTSPRLGLRRACPVLATRQRRRANFGHTSPEMVEVVGRGCVGEAHPRPRRATRRGGGRPTRAPPTIRSRRARP